MRGLSTFLLAMPALLVSLGSAPAMTPEEKKAAIAYVQSLQTNIGGFLMAKPAPNVRVAPALGPTSSAVRALHYLGGELKNKDATRQFVERCFNAESGGFSQFAGGNDPTVFLTAVGIMAVTELGMPVDKFGPGAIRFLSENAKGFEDIRIAAAGLERLSAKSPKNDAWAAELKRMLNADGTAGAGAGLARDTGSVVVTFLRLGGKPANLDAVKKAIRDGQRPDGGFGKADSRSSDLETTYRVVRCFVMIKETPADVQALRAFVAKCRNEDGGYGIGPGQPSNVSATYFAAIVTHWLDQK